MHIYLADFSSQVVSEFEWESPLRALCPEVSLEISSTWWSNKLLASASRDKDELSQSLLRPDLRLSREGGVEREGGVVGDEVVVERDGGVGEWWRGGDEDLWEVWDLWDDLWEGSGLGRRGEPVLSISEVGGGFCKISGRNALSTAEPRFPIEIFLCLA